LIERSLFLQIALNQRDFLKGDRINNHLQNQTMTVNNNQFYALHLAITPTKIVITLNLNRL